MGHRDCGAYKVILKAEHAQDPGVEKDTHPAQLKVLRGMINEKYPKLDVETLLRSLDGKVETVG